MVIKTKSVFAAVDTEKDGLRILLTDRQPYSKCSYEKWFPQLSASKELMKKWRQEEIDQEGFKKLFIEEIKNNPNACTVISKIAERMMLRQGHKLDNDKANITLLCACHSLAYWCHRHIIKELVEEENLRLRTTGKEEAKARRQEKILEQQQQQKKV